MALTDTARLIASLELQDKFSKPLNNADRGLGGFERRLKSTERVAQGVSRGIGTALKIGLGAAVAGGALLAVNIKKGIDSLNELESVTVATNTVIKSTEGIAGQTAKEIRNLSEEYEDLNATMDDKVIQSGANLLLTFTNIRDKAFEPALEAALNMNEAMGGGPEGLQTTIIQVGKALNDPIKGIGALRRVGVQLSEQQERQVKRLVEQNDLYGAQRVILGELTTQFGGRFAAAGQTAEGRMAALGDRIEDLQKALAGPLIPVIDRVREKLIDFLGSRRVLRGAEQLGQAIASLFTEERLDKGVALLEKGIDLLTGRGGGSGNLTAKLGTVTEGISTVASTVANLPWEAIANAARLLGTGSKALLDAFLGLPPWVQTAVLTGWGLNKLTGGALGGIVSELGKGLIKGVLNMNAGVVNLRAATVTGGGPGGPVGGGGRGGRLGGGFLGGFAGTLAVAGGTVLGGVAVEKTITAINEGTEVGQGIRNRLDSMDTKTLAGATQRLQAIDAQVQQAEDNLVGNLFGIDDRLRSGFAEERANLVRQIGTLNANEGQRAAAALGRLDGIRGTQASANATLQQIRDKRETVNVTVNTSTNVTLAASEVALRVQQLTQTVQGPRVE